MKIKNMGLGLLAAGVLFSGNAFSDGPSSASMLANTCAGCHGTNGASAGDSMPIVGGLDKRFLAEILTQFKTGERDSTIMGRIMRGYSDLEIQAIASHMGKQEWVSSNSKVNQALVTQGQEIHDSQCKTCHKENGIEQDDETPRLAGQWPDYTQYMLYRFHDIGSPASQPRKMRKRVQKLSQEELDALADFYAAQK